MYFLQKGVTYDLSFPGQAITIIKIEALCVDFCRFWAVKMRIEDTAVTDETEAERGEETGLNRWCLRPALAQRLLAEHFQRGLPLAHPAVSLISNLWIPHDRVGMKTW